MPYVDVSPRYRKLTWKGGRPYLYEEPIQDGQTLRVRWPNSREQTLEVELEQEVGESWVWYCVFVPVIVHGLRTRIQVTEHTDLEFAKTDR